MPRCNPSGEVRGPLKVLPWFALILVPLVVVGAVCTAAVGPGGGFSSPTVWAFVAGFLLAVAGCAAAGRKFRLLSRGIVHFKLMNKQDLRLLTRVELVEESEAGELNPSEVVCDPPLADGTCRQKVSRPSKHARRASVKVHHAPSSKPLAVTPTVIEFANLDAANGVESIVVEKRVQPGGEDVYCRINFTNGNGDPDFRWDAEDISEDAP